MRAFFFMFNKNSTMDNTKGMKIENLTIEELVNYEKAAAIVCARYEKNIKSYDGSIINDTQAVATFETFNKIYNKITKELEKRLLSL